MSKDDILKKGKVLESKDGIPSKIRTPKFRVSFPSVFRPDSFGDSEPKYGLTMLFDKDDTDLTLMKKAVEAVARAKFDLKKLKAKKKKLKLPFRDGDTDDARSGYDGYENNIFVNVTSKVNKPKVVGLDKKDIENESDFYAGCFARAVLSIYPFDRPDSKGVTFGLLSVQKLEDGNPFGTSSDPESDFDDEVSEALADNDNDNDDDSFEDDDLWS